VFQTVTLLGFALRRIPLPRHGSDLSAHPARMALAQTDLPTRAVQILARLPGIALRESPLSPASRRSGWTRASLGLCFPSRGTLPPRRLRARRRLPPAGLVDFDASTEPGTGPSECRSRRVSKLSEESLSPSWGFRTSSRRTGCRCRTGLNPGSTFPACYFALFADRFVCPFGLSAPQPVSGSPRKRLLPRFRPVAESATGYAHSDPRLGSPSGLLHPSGSKR
jgi:hypothetical protein